jgi:insulysin
MVKYFDNLIKSESDKNTYRAFRLDNELTVFLIQNPTAEKAAASLVTHVGSLRDPQDHQGLAHFLEHMLFIGSEKYPGEGDYMTYVSQNGGYTNAYTASTVTNYHFEVKDDKLITALDMFAQFFISPLFKEESVAKEINAVNSEAEMYYNNDMWRQYHLFSLLCEQKSLVSKYNVGNLDTLGNLRGYLPSLNDKSKEGEDAPAEPKPMDPEAEQRKKVLVQTLKNFHKQYYSANQMALAIYTAGDLVELEKQVVEIFSKIENKKIPYATFKNDPSPFPYPKETLGKLVKVVPVSKGRSLKLVFCIPEYSSQKYTKSGNYLSHLIGHESKGSILDLLSEEGLATSLSSGFDLTEDYYSDMTVTIRLTKEGGTPEGIKKVISTVGAYISMLLKEGPQEWVYDEIKTQAELNFKYQDTTGGVGKCIDIANNCLECENPEEVLYFNSVHKGFVKEAIQEITSLLNPEHLLAFLSSEDLTPTEEFLTDPIYKTRYAVSDLSAELVDAFKKGDLSWSKVSAGVHLPEKNTFLPKNFGLKAQPVIICNCPKACHKAEQSTLWHWQDDKFKLPKAITTLLVYLNPTKFAASLKHSLLMAVWAELFREKIRSLSYMAEMAKIESSVSTNHFGLEFTVSCFDESLKPYLIKLIEVLGEFSKEPIEADKFEIHRANVELGYSKRRVAAPYSYTISELFSHTTQGYYSVDESLAVIKHLKVEDIKPFAAQLFSEMRFEWIFEGNFTEAEATETAAAIEAQFKQNFNHNILRKEDVSQNRVAKFPSNSKILFEIDSIVPGDKNCCFIRLYQSSNSDENSAHLNFLTNWMKNLYFEDLRTQQQLGYAVFATSRNLNGVRHFMFLIQSDVKPTHFCIERTEVFLSKMREELKQMPAEKFAEIQAGVIAGLKEPNKTLSDQYSEDWAEIKSHQYKFDRKVRLISQVEQLTKDVIVDYFENLFYKNPQIMELHFYSQESKEESIRLREKRQETEGNLILYSSLAEFRRSAELHADKQSFLH